MTRATAAAPKQVQVQEPPEETAQVMNGFTLMHFVRVKPKKETSGERFLNLELSVGLSEESSGQFGPEIENAFSLFQHNAELGRLDISETVPQLVDVSARSDTKPALHVASVVPQHVRLQLVEQSGSGEARKVIRLSFELPIPQTNPVATWALGSYDNLVWVKLQAMQGKFAGI